MRVNVMIRYVAVLLAAILGLMVADNLRPWKRLQLEFHELERSRLQSRLDATRAAAADHLADLEARIESHEAALADRQDEIAELEEDLRRFGGKARAAERRRSRLESELERIRHDGRPTAGTEFAEALRQTRIEVESLGELIADRESKLAAVRSDLGAAREDLARARAPIEDLEVRLAALPSRQIFPLGGLGAPGVAVREVALPALSTADDPTPRVDRCVTCHLGAVHDDVESDGWPAPFNRHPALDLFLSTDSPHPYPSFGCTTCHGGEGRATDFSRAGHAPATAEQARRWQQDLSWQAGEGRAMRPLDLTEAACGRCHGGEAPRGNTPPAASGTLHQGRRWLTALGCTGCHLPDVAISGDSSAASPTRPEPKVGPSLVGIAGKTTPAWAYRWLEAPHAFRETTRMPHVFDLGEEVSDDDRKRRSAEIRAAVDYLWQVSRPVAYPPPPVGEVEAGRALFETIGCTGCHRLGLRSLGEESADGEAPVPFEHRHGPHLAGTGSKVDAGWLHAWLQDPRAYRLDTPMPSLRLDASEAADLTTYLMTRRDPAWEGLSLPSVDVETRDRLTLAALAQSHTLEASQERLERMSDRNRNVYLGEQVIATYGCHGCHQIQGFEQAEASAPTLRQASDRLRDRLASPDVLAGPDVHRWRAASHQPAYRLSDDQARAVTVALLGLPDEWVAPEDERTAVLTQGRRILARYNCRGCHRIEGRGGLPGRAPPDGVSPDASPPDLAHVGARLKAPWLYAYLADPGGQQVRPWLEVRMPTFGLTAAENNSLVRYFAMLDDRPLFAAASPTPPPATDVAVGRVVFGMLHCGDCHQPASEESFMPQVAPSYHRAADRLRSDWVVSLILDPERWLPGTPMPANFLAENGVDSSSSYLIGSINTPIFAVERDRLRRLLGSEEELQAYLSDPERVAAALRDYLWTLGK